MGGASGAVEKQILRFAQNDRWVRYEVTDAPEAIVSMAGSNGPGLKPLFPASVYSGA